MYISYFIWLLMYISYFIWLLPKKSPSRWIFMFLLLDKKTETQEEKWYAGYEGQKKVKVKVTQSCLTLKPHELYSPRNFPSQNTGVVSLSLLQGVFPTQGSNPGHLYCRWTFLPSEPQGKPKNIGMGSLSLLQGIFLTQELNQGLLHCRWSLCHLSYQGWPAEQGLNPNSIKHTARCYFLIVHMKASCIHFSWAVSPSSAMLFTYVIDQSSLIVFA